MKRQPQIDIVERLTIETFATLSHKRQVDLLAEARREIGRLRCFERAFIIQAQHEASSREG